MTAYIYRLEPEQRPWQWALAFDYSVEMVEGIKRCIPSRQRKWLPDQRQWWFKADAESTMLYLAERYCGSVQHVQETGSFAPAVSAEKVEAYRTLHLLPSAPDEAVKAVYRALSKLHHPDAGGTTKAMQTINEAYGRLTQR